MSVHIREHLFNILILHGFYKNHRLRKGLLLLRKQPPFTSHAVSDMERGLMHTEIKKTFAFEAAHRLPHVEATHKCFKLHGHSFRVTLRVRGELDPIKGWIVDFAALTNAWRPLHQQLDHQLLNEIAGLENPTSELLAHWIVGRIQIQGARLSSVTVHETCMASATVFL